MHFIPELLVLFCSAAWVYPILLYTWWYLVFLWSNLVLKVLVIF